MTNPSSKRTTRDEEHAILSTSSILILSGFLVGLTVGCEIGDDLSPFVLASGLAGFVAYLGLDVVATRRREEMVAAEQRQMEQRLDKHVLSLSNLGFVLPEQPAREREPSRDEIVKPRPASVQPSETRDLQLTKL